MVVGNQLHNPTCIAHSAEKSILLSQTHDGGWRRGAIISITLCLLLICVSLLPIHICTSLLSLLTYMYIYSQSAEKLVCISGCDINSVTTMFLWVEIRLMNTTGVEVGAWYHLQTPSTQSLQNEGHSSFSPSDRSRQIAHVLRAGACCVVEYIIKLVVT